MTHRGPSWGPEQQKDYLRRYYQKHRKERLREQAERYRTDPEYRARRKAEAATYAQTHREARRAYRRRYYEENRERLLAQQKRHASTPERKAARAAYDRAYKQAHKAKINAYQYARQRSYKRGHTVAEWEAKKADYGHACAYCGASDRPLERDHIVPVGIGDPETVDLIINIVPACRSCNARKSGPKRNAPIPNMRPWSGLLPDLVCPQCGKSFRPGNRNRFQRCCSNACRFAWQRAHPESHWHRLPQYVGR